MFKGLTSNPGCVCECLTFSTILRLSIKARPLLFHRYNGIFWYLGFVRQVSTSFPLNCKLFLR